jgi:hypothetical protein
MVAGHGSTSKRPRDDHRGLDGADAIKF